jgi:hypothetical protein
MSEVFGSPIIQFIILATLSVVARALFMRKGNSPTASGAIAMAIGIFVLGALQQMPFPVKLLTQLLTIEGLIVWAFIVASYASSYQHGTFHLHTENPVGCFAVGTWVAGTAVLCRLTDVVLPQWRPLTLILAILTVLIWLWFLSLIVGKLPLIIPRPADVKVTGIILLAVVSTQSVVLMVEQLFPQQAPGWLMLLLISLGCAFYLAGLILIMRRYREQKGWHLTDDWDNTNCILHGAMSITGLAAVESRVAPTDLIVAIWGWATLVFVFVEAVEIARLCVRVRAYGWQRGVFSYAVSQWARNFTFGMFYAFTLRLHNGLGLAGSGGSEWLAAVQGFIVGYGQYVVLLLLLVELALFAAKNIAMDQGLTRIRSLTKWTT